MLALIFCVVAAVFAFRYFSLKHALREMDRELLEIRQELSRNQILHLPLPDRDLERVMQSVNHTLEEVRRERQGYEKREAEFQRLIENISHDLRTPLTVILGYLKWMKKGEKAPDALEIIERNARAMEKLVSQFYDFSRLNAQDYALELKEVDVCRLLRESIAGNYQVLEASCLNLHSSLPEHPVQIRGNTDALDRIFSNLFQNAARYAHSGLEICLEEAGQGQVRIFFQNDGEGMTEEELAHLFDRFYRNDSSRHRSGSGLGLTVARSLAELMGGTLTARLLEPGDGPDGADGTAREDGTAGADGTVRAAGTAQAAGTARADRAGKGLVSIQFILTLNAMR